MPRTGSIAGPVSLADSSEDEHQYIGQAVRPGESGRAGGRDPPGNRGRSHSLVIEITETMVMENLDMAMATMNQLRAMGIHIHIDDFGTGYSSLSYLHRLPINALKIDRSFISKLTADGENQEIILSIISLAKSLNFDVIAEGVELDHHLVQIKKLQCRFAQGFLFSRPHGVGRDRCVGEGGEAQDLNNERNEAGLTQYRGSVTARSEAIVCKRTCVS